MKTAGELYKQYQREFQDPNKIRDAGPLSWMDAVPSVAGAVGLHEPLLAAGMFVRPAIRGLLESRLSQDRFILPHVRTPRSPFESMVRRSVRALPSMPAIGMATTNAQQPQRSR